MRQMYLKQPGNVKPAIRKRMVFVDHLLKRKKENKNLNID